MGLQMYPRVGIWEDRKRIVSHWPSPTLLEQNLMPPWDAPGNSKFLLLVSWVQGTVVEEDCELANDKARGFREKSLPSYLITENLCGDIESFRWVSAGTAKKITCSYASFLCCRCLWASCFGSSFTVAFLHLPWLTSGIWFSLICSSHRFPSSWLGCWIKTFQPTCCWESPSFTRVARTWR